MRRILQSAAMVLCMVWACVVTAQQLPYVLPEYERTGGPYVPTPMLVVDQMLDMAKVSEQDHVIDLGSGDGVIVITAAYQRKASGYGVDIDEELVRHSNQRAQNLGIDGRVHFEAKDVFKADVSKATVVTLYLLPEMMQRLRNKLYAELRPGTRIVSHDYHFEEWLHDAEVAIDVPEKEFISGVPSATLYLWTVPAKVGGVWRMQVDGERVYELTLNQQYQSVEGWSVSGDHKANLLEPQMNGSEISFVMPHQGPDHGSYFGRIDGDQMEGIARFSGGKVVRWRAVRSKIS
jgi:precorrin-6B methylase 2